MKLTVALGLQYDSSATTAGKMPAIPESVSVSDGAGEVTAAVIDLPSSGMAAETFEFSSKHGYFFLTYSLQGLPMPISEQHSRLDLFT